MAPRTSVQAYSLGVCFLQATSYYGFIRDNSANGRALPIQRIDLSWRGGLKGKGFLLMAAPAPRSLCAMH